MTIKLQSLDREIQVEKLRVGKFIECLKVLKNIPKHLGGFDKIDQAEIISQLPHMIASSYDEIVEIITIATDLKREDIEKLYTEELIELAGDIVVVNEFNKIGEAVKKKFGSIDLQAIKR